MARSSWIIAQLLCLSSPGAVGLLQHGHVENMKRGTPSEPCGAGSLGPCCEEGTPASDSSTSISQNGIKMLLTAGCSGSTMVLKIAENLHKLAGFHIADCKRRREVLSDIELGYYSGNVSITRQQLPYYFEKLIVHLEQHDKTLLFKENKDFATRDDKLTAIIQKHGHAGLFLRQNLIDLVLCEIRDGFGETGNAGFCHGCGNFRGRGLSKRRGINEAEQISLWPDRLLHSLHTLSRGQELRQSWLRENFPKTERGFTQLLNAERGSLENVSLRKFAFEHSDQVMFEPRAGAASFDNGVVASEDLFEFEWNPLGLPISIIAWHRLMWAIGSPMSREVIGKYLHFLGRTREAPKKHHELIANFDAVKDAIDGCEADYNDQWCASIRGMLRQ